MLASCRAVPSTSEATPPQGETSRTAEASPAHETKPPPWWCFGAQSEAGETFDHCLRAAEECESLVTRAQGDERVVENTPRCAPQSRAHCMTTPGGETYCMAELERCDHAFKSSIAAYHGWWGAATACTELGTDDTMAVTPVEPAFAGGECIRAKDGYIWMIARVEDGRYYATGWQGNAWGNVANFDVGHFEHLGYERTECPQRML